MMLVKLGLAEGPSPETILAYDQVSQCALYVVSAIAPALAVALALVSSPFSLLLVLVLVLILTDSIFFLLPLSLTRRFFVRYRRRKKRPRR